MPPNFLFLIADDHRHNAMGSLGTPAVATPNLDALAAAGTVFTHAHNMGSTSAAVCMPSRAMLLTGRSLFRVFGSDPAHAFPYPMDPALQTFPELLRSAGYRTYGVGKWHNEPELYARSFDAGGRIFFGGMSDHDAVPLHAFSPDGQYPPEAATPGRGFSTELFVDEASRLLRHHPSDNPFCMYVAFTSPHDPRTPPSVFADMYPEAEVELPPNFRPAHGFDNGELGGRDESLASHPRDPAEVRRHISEYYGMITHLDAQIGILLEELQTSGYADNTIVVYTADHGLAVGQHGLLGKQNVYDHSLRVPLIMRGPGIPTGEQRDGLCYLMDVCPTILDLAGHDAPAGCEGTSLLPSLHDRTTGLRTSVFGAFQRGRTVGADGLWQRAVRDGGWKLIETCAADSCHTQLFNVATDPWEIHDYVDDPSCAERQARLQSLLRKQQHAVGDPLVR